MTLGTTSDDGGLVLHLASPNEEVIDRIEPPRSANAVLSTYDVRNQNIGKAQNALIFARYHRQMMMSNGAAFTPRIPY